MPLPLIAWLGIAAVSAAGGKALYHGVQKSRESAQTMEAIQHRQLQNTGRLQAQTAATVRAMDHLGQSELEIQKSFAGFSDAFEKIKNRPRISQPLKNGVELPEYNVDEIKNLSVGSAVLLGALGGAASGTAGGIAAAGGAYAAIAALGTASTGTAISSLSGAAATNATLAALGGGSIASGGGGMAAGALVLGTASLGIGLMVGSLIFTVSTVKLSKKVEEAKAQADKTEQQINEICTLLMDLQNTSIRYEDALAKVNALYLHHYYRLFKMVMLDEQTDWNTYTDEEKKIVEHTVLLVKLLHSMCKVPVAIQPENGPLKQVNSAAIEQSLANADVTLCDPDMHDSDE